jgi:hypothetical protein
MKAALRSILPSTKTITLLIITFLLVTLNGVPASAISLTQNAVLGGDHGFVSPAGVTADAINAKVYVADYGADKVWKIDVTNPLTPIIDGTFVLNVSKPVSVAYYSGSLYVVTESNGGKKYDMNGQPATYPTFGSGYTGTDAYKNLVKPSDVTVGTDGNIYVVDLGDYYVKVYSAADGSFPSTGGLIGGQFPINNPTTSYGNGQFYLPSSIYFESAENKLVVADTGNMTPYYQMTVKYNPFRKTYVTSLSFYGKPKGKVQVFANPGSGYVCSPGTTGARTLVTHNAVDTSGEVLNVAGVWGDTNYLYVVDSLKKKIFIYDNAAIDGKVTTWGTALPANTVPVSNPVTVDPATAPAGSTAFRGVFGLGIYDSVFTQLRDVVVVGSTLVITDTAGRVFFFGIS